MKAYFFFISLKYLFPFIFYLSGGKTYQPASHKDLGGGKLFSNRLNLKLSMSL